MTKTSTSVQSFARSVEAQNSGTTKTKEDKSAAKAGSAAKPKPSRDVSEPPAKKNVFANRRPLRATRKQPSNGKDGGGKLHHPSTMVTLNLHGFKAKLDNSTATLIRARLSKLDAETIGKTIDAYKEFLESAEFPAAVKAAAIESTEDVSQLQAVAEKLSGYEPPAPLTIDYLRTAIGAPIKAGNKTYATLEEAFSTLITGDEYTKYQTRSHGWVGARENAWLSVVERVEKEGLTVEAAIADMVLQGEFFDELLRLRRSSAGYVWEKASLERLTPFECDSRFSIETKLELLQGTTKVEHLASRIDTLIEATQAGPVRERLKSELGKYRDLMTAQQFDGLSRAIDASNWVTRKGYEKDTVELLAVLPRLGSISKPLSSFMFRILEGTISGVHQVSLGFAGQRPGDVAALDARYRLDPYASADRVTKKHVIAFYKRVEGHEFAAALEKDKRLTPETKAFIRDYVDTETNFIFSMRSEINKEYHQSLPRDWPSFESRLASEMKRKIDDAVEVFSKLGPRELGPMLEALSQQRQDGTPYELSSGGKDSLSNAVATIRANRDTLAKELGALDQP